jgi:cytochrome c oxidase accessory protein FixG
MRQEKDLFKLTSLDATGGRINIIPAEVKGYFRRHRDWTQGVLLLIFLALPWIYVNGQQLVFFSIPERRFHLFGVVFFAHDAPLIFFLLAMTTLGLALVTAIWGRVWCGWACPQTVFIDAVYRRIERWTEGQYLERRKLQNSELSLNKIIRTGGKWLLFTLVSSLIAHSFIAYFTGSRELLEMIQKPPGENWTYFILVVGFTALLLFDFAWFREQFCVIMCPYGRIQSVLLEPSSLSVVYDTARGEPRKGRSDAGKKTGDCVSCNRCVEVCPTGIDIRNGLQMECIGCTACIDACDEIMHKVQKPAGLISYKTLDNSKVELFKFKNITYALLICLAGIGLTYSLKTRESLNISVLRALDTPYTFTTDSNGRSVVLNHFRIHMNNQSSKTSELRVQLSDDSVKTGFILTVAQNPILLKSHSATTWHLFVSAPREVLEAQGSARAEFVINNQDGERFVRELTILGPKNEL